MRRKLFITLFVLVAVPCVQAQEMNVIRMNGEVEQFNLADIDSVTFGVDDSVLKSALGDNPRSTNDILRLYTQDGIFQFLVAEIDSVCFVDENLMTIHQGAGDTSEFNLAEVDSMTFANSSENTVSITYSGGTATVSNPLEGVGVTVEVVGADVTVTSTAGIAGIEYLLSGSTPDGTCKFYSDSDFTLRLNGVDITNLDGPAINIQADHTIAVQLAEGTTSILVDGLTYADPPGGEDQKAAFFSEGQLIFFGPGSVIVHGQGGDQHGLGSDDYVEVQSGNIVIESAVKDGIHTNEGYFQLGGSVEVVTSGSDGVDAGDGPVEIAGGSLTVLSQNDGKDALKCNGELFIAGGEIDLTVEGDRSKGLNAVDVLLTGGTVTINTSGGVVLEPSGAGFNPSYCVAVKADNQALLDGSQLTITAIGEAGRGISSEGDIFIQSGNLSITSSGNGGAYTDETGEQDAYHGPCLNADGDLVLSGGTVTLSHSGSAGKGIAGDGDLSIGTALSSPVLGITTTGPRIYIGGGNYAEAKAISVDSLITIDNGELTISSADDGIKSKFWIDINDGLINILNSEEGIEGPNIYINGGETHVRAHDDGLNPTYGVDGEFNDGSILVINGGWVHVSTTGGDCIDSNGNFTMNGGTLLVHGPPNQPEVGMDINGTILVNGGFMVIAQVNSSHVETPSNQSDQRTVLLRTSQYISAGTLFHIEDTNGTSLLTFEPERRYSAVHFSSPDLTDGTTYRVYTGGSCTGEEKDGLYIGGVYTPGTLRTTFTMTGMVMVVTF